MGLKRNTKKGSVLTKPGPQGEVIKGKLSAKNWFWYLSLLLQTNNPKLNHTKITGLCKAIKTDNILNSEFYEVPGKTITCSSPTNDCVYRLQINSSSISPIWQHPLKALFFLWTIYLLYKKTSHTKRGTRILRLWISTLLSDILSLYGRFISCGITMFNKITMKHETHTDDVLHFLRITNLWKGHRIHCYHCYHLHCRERFFSDRHGYYAYRHKSSFQKLLQNLRIPWRHGTYTLPWNYLSFYNPLLKTDLPESSKVESASFHSSLTHMFWDGLHAWPCADHWVCKRKDIALYWQSILSAEGTKSDCIGAEGKGASQWLSR